MSLFEAREWWSAIPDDAGDDILRVSRRAMVVANIDNQDPAQDKIVVGSLDGHLRIYAPSQRDYRIEDLVSETNLGHPVLQVAAGRFLSTKSGLALALLHPRSLVVYEVIPVGGFGKGSRYYSIQLQYEHVLEAPAHSLVFGQFGGSDMDSICVQSMDGRLSFFERNAVSFSCTLPNILVPVPLAYVSRSDSFVIINAEMTCECYSYQALGSSHAFNSKNPGSDSVQRAWGCQLGQHAVDILITRFIDQTGPSQSDIVIVGERSLMALKSQGTLSMSKTFSDLNPSCVTSYTVGPSNEVGARNNIIVGTHQKLLLVFRDAQLLWAARTKAVPISLAVGSFSAIPGMIVAMFQNGEVQVCYLGTDPLSISRSSPASEELDYTTVTEQYRSLQKTIRQMQAGSVGDSGKRKTLILEHDIKMDLSVNKSTFQAHANAEFAMDSSGSPFSALVSLRITCDHHEPIGCLHVSIMATSGIITEKNTLILKNIGHDSVSPTSCQFRVFASKSIMPLEQLITIAASFCTSDNQTHTVLHSVPLPFELFGVIVPPIRNSQHFVTLNTNRPAPSSLSVLFPLIDPPESGNVLSMKYHCKGIDCTVILSKNAGRFRIQSSEFHGLSLLTSLLILRLRWYWNLNGEVQDQAQKSDGPLKISFDGELPLEEFWTRVDLHLAARNAISDKSIKMEKLSQQLRVIQKRLLSRFRDSTPSSLSNLDILLRETLNELITVGDECRILEENVKQTGNEIACCLSLLSNMLTEICQLDEDNASCLRAFLSPILDEGIDQGFEERLDAGLAYLLSGPLAKEDKSQPLQLGTELAIPSDTKRLRKHLRIVVDRLMKGMLIHKDEGLTRRQRSRVSTKKSEPMDAETS